MENMKYQMDEAGQKIDCTTRTKDYGTDSICQPETCFVITCIALFDRMKEHPTLRVNFDTQRALKRLDEKHFLEHTKK